MPETSAPQPRSDRSVPQVKEWSDELVDEFSKDEPEFKARVSAAVRRRQYLRGLARLREDRGLRQDELADKIGTSQSAVARLEKGATDPKLSTLERYAAALGLVCDWSLVSQDEAASRQEARVSGRASVVLSAGEEFRELLAAGALAALLNVASDTPYIEAAIRARAVLQQSWDLKELANAAREIARSISEYGEVGTVRQGTYTFGDFATEPRDASGKSRG